MRGSAAIILGDLASRMDGKAFEAAHSQFHAGAGWFPGQKAMGGAVLDLAAYRERLNARRIDAALAGLRPEGRSDSFSTTTGFNLARSLQYVHETVMEEEYPLLNAFRLFSTDESVPVGATSWVARRGRTVGEARVYRGPGDHIPRVAAQQVEEEFPIRHVVAGYSWDIFEAQSDSYAKTGRLTTLERGTRNVIMELLNRLFWQGAPQHGLYGILNYPWLPKFELGVGFLPATVAAAPDATLAAINTLINFPHSNSRSLFQPNMIVTTNAVMDVLSSVRFGVGSDRTILEHMKANSKHITKFEIAWELEDCGGAGIDGILACRDDQEGIQLVMPQGVTQLPVQIDGLESRVIDYASLGGIHMPSVQNNVLGYVNTAA